MFRRTSRDPLIDQLTDLGVPRAQANELARLGVRVHMPAGRQLCRAGEFGRETFILLSGSAAVEVAATGETVVVNPGAVIGERAVLDPTVGRNADVSMLEDGWVLVFSVREFLTVADSPAIDHLAVPA